MQGYKNPAFFFDFFCFFGGAVPRSPSRLRRTGLLELVHIPAYFSLYFPVLIVCPSLYTSNQIVEFLLVSRAS